MLKLNNNIIFVYSLKYILWYLLSAIVSERVEFFVELYLLKMSDS